MNSKDFIQVMRKIIREEVRSAVRDELSIIGGSLAESRNTTSRKSTVTPKVLATKPVYQPARKPAVKKPYVNNPMLNDILNDTGGFTNDGPRAYLEEQIDYNDFAEWPSMNMGSINKAQSNISMLPTTDSEGRRIDVAAIAKTEAGQEVVQALTRDYSSLMKAIDKKKGK
jgi:hypothetical protein